MSSTPVANKYCLLKSKKDGRKTDQHLKCWIAPFSCERRFEVEVRMETSISKCFLFVLVLSKFQISAWVWLLNYYCTVTAAFLSSRRWCIYLQLRQFINKTIFYLTSVVLHNTIPIALEMFIKLWSPQIWKHVHNNIKITEIYQVLGV